MKERAAFAPKALRRAAPELARRASERRREGFSRAGILVLALAFLALHLPYVPSSLEDLDSINFALGLHAFDVARHQPHPPGYPVFIAFARGARSVTSSDVTALSSVSIAAGALGVLAIAWLFTGFALSSRDRRSPEGFAQLATAIAVTSPLYWVTAARPLSDSLGLTAAIAVQALTLRVRTPRTLALAAFLAGLAIGIRSQVFWLTLPLLALRGREFFSRGSRRTFPTPLFGLVMGVFVWLIPLLAFSGGPIRYWRAVFAQGEEDLSGIRMLWTTPTVRELADAFYYAFVAPWAVWPMALVVLAAAAIGVGTLWKRDRSTLVKVAAAFGPYLVFDVLFQETFTSRYALPMVVPVALLAVHGISLLPRNAAAVTCIAIAMFDAHVGGRSLAAYSRQPAPAFAMLADMRQAAEQSSVAPVLAPDRRQSLDLRKPLVWMGKDAPRFDRQLAAPPQHEWLQAVGYWNAGGRSPVWFAVDPRRAAMALVQHGEPAAYRWSIPQRVLFSGTRPADMDWYRIDRPDWYVGEGWALSPEAAGVANADGQGLRFGPITASLRSGVLDGGALIIGGRNFDPSRSARLTIAAGDAWSKSLDAAPGFFVDAIRFPASGNGTRPEYVTLTVSSSPPVDVAIEQFDASSTRGVIGFGSGWFEPELDPRSGARWRWISGRAELGYMTGAGDWSLHIEGESARKYYPRDSRLVVRSGSAVLLDTTVGSDFTLDIPVPAAHAAATLVVETDQTHVPAETAWRRTSDRRRLALRIFRCELRPRVSGRGTAASSPPAR